jgi:hypothetical protein
MAAARWHTNIITGIEFHDRHAVAFCDVYATPV